MPKMANYVYNRILDVMVFGKIEKFRRTSKGLIEIVTGYYIDSSGKKRERKEKFSLNEWGVDYKSSVYKYDFFEDAINIFAFPPGGFDRKERINLVQHPLSLKKIASTTEYIQLAVMAESIYDGVRQQQVQECIRWLQSNPGPSKIKINAHGAIDGKISMVWNHSNKNEIPGERLADWLINNGLKSPLKNDIFVDASNINAKWESKSSSIQCPSCKMNFLHGVKQVHCRVCGGAVHLDCVREVQIRGAMRSNVLGRVFSSRNMEVTTDVACLQCVKAKGVARPREILGTERKSDETWAERQSFQGVINIGLWTCYGAVTQKNNPLINLGNDEVIANSIAHRLGARLRDKKVRGIEITGRTDITQQVPVAHPDGSGNPYYRLGQRGPQGQQLIIKKRIFS
jgi:hypothetical protein